MIKPDTIGQYTGWKNTRYKNRKKEKVFEKDILKGICIEDYGEESISIGYVFWSRSFHSFLVAAKTNKGKKYCIPLRDFILIHDNLKYSIEIIGNKYDNPELLKEVSK